MTEEGRLDPELVAGGDRRNVVDRYRKWSVAAIKADLGAGAFPIHIAVENYQHDYNIGTIVRSANAFNVGGVHIIGKRHWNRRGAMATDKYLEIYQHTTISEFEAWATARNLRVIGVDNIAGSVALGTTMLPTQAVYVFGQEGPGLSSEMQTVCSPIIAIEQFGSTRSINLGVAAGILLYEWVRQNKCL